mgnify:FL=1
MEQKSNTDLMSDRKFGGLQGRANPLSVGVSDQEGHRQDMSESDQDYDFENTDHPGVFVPLLLLVACN